MRLQRALVLVPLASAFVITDTDIFERIGKAEHKLVDSAKEALNNIPLQDVFEQSQDILGDAIGRGVASVETAGKDAYRKIHEVGCDMESWLNDPLEDVEMDEVLIGPSVPEEDVEEIFGEHFEEDFEDKDCSEHDKPPHHGKPPHGKPPHHGPPRHGPPHHKKPHHPPHNKPSNLTIYELISKSNYTTKLAKLIDEYPDLVEKLNGTKANYTVFAPIDSAFEKIPHHGHKPSKEDIEKVLLYHVSEEFYPAGRVLHSYTIPTLYEPELLGHKQRLTVRVTSRGPAINFYSKLIAVNIFGTNGVIHGVDSILVPPPNVASIIDLLPGEFSTLELALGKTGLFDKINSTDYPHNGGTFFAPSNFAFKKLGPRVNAFLFSKYGQRYLKALLEYHMVINQTLYTDAFYDASSEEADETSKGGYQFNLPTLLGDKYLFVSIRRFGPFVSIRLNGYSRVTFHDGVASDGVIQVVSDVLIPPKKPKDGDSRQTFWNGEEMSVAELRERLDPYIEDNLEL